MQGSVWETALFVAARSVLLGSVLGPRLLVTESRVHQSPGAGNLQVRVSSPGCCMWASSMPLPLLTHVSYSVKGGARDQGVPEVLGYLGGGGRHTVSRGSLQLRHG